MMVRNTIRSFVRNALLTGAACGACAANAADKPAFRDLNHNQKRDAYENPALPTENRVADLL